MTTLHHCPSCGKPLSEDAPQGLCPECLIRSGFYTGSVPPSAPGGGRSAFTPPTLEQLRELFPQLEIVSLIGRGGMGAVYKARQTQLNRWIAVKILARDVEADPQFAERFRREAQALAQLSHQNIVTVYDFGESGGLFYLLMEFVDGLNLRQVQQSRKLQPAEALAIVPAICEALQYAHQQGIVHRDIKPENILMDTQGRVKIADFGIAKILGNDTKTDPITGDQQIIGTPHYMAPEQVEKPASVDQRADIYSLGVVFYEMLTGELPLGRFAPPSQKVQIDVRLDEIVLRALEKEPSMRYQQASELKSSVEVITSGVPSVTDSVAATPRHTLKRIAWALTVVIFYAGIILGLLVPQVLRFNGHYESVMAAVMLLCLPVIRVVAGRLVRRWSKEVSVRNSWIRTWGGVGVLAALPVIGFAVFFGIGFLSESGGWNPRPKEFVFVSLTFLGALLLPAASWVLLTANQAGAARSHDAPRTLWKKTGISLVQAGIIAFTLQTFLVQVFRVETDAVSVGIPKGSHAVVWKLQKSYMPDDIIMYHGEKNVMVARVTEASNLDRSVKVTRGTDDPFLVQGSALVGKVIFNTRSTPRQRDVSRTKITEARMKEVAEVRAQEDARSAKAASTANTALTTASMDGTMPAGPELVTSPTGLLDAQTLSTKWKPRLLALNNAGWREAFRVGQQIADLPGDEGLAVLQASWSSITNVEARQQLLKAFSFASHPRVPAVLELALLDPAPPVQTWALNYLGDLSFVDFSSDYAAAKSWIGNRRNQLTTEVMALSLEDAAKVLMSDDKYRVRGKLEYLAHNNYHIRNNRDLVANAGLYTALAHVLKGDNEANVLLALNVALPLPYDAELAYKAILPRIGAGNSAEVVAAAARALGRKEHTDNALILSALIKAVAAKEGTTISALAGALGDSGKSEVIPTLIGLIESHNAYDTVYGIGYFGLQKLTGVGYDVSHDGAWWRQWWQQNKSRYSAAVQAMEIPRFDPVK